MLDRGPAILPRAAEPVVVPEDRSLVVPPGRVIATAYVPIHKVRLACRDRMGVGDVERAYRRQLALGPAQAWPCPNGTWEGETFVVADGRHQVVAALMLGFEHLLVAWVETDG